jgi:hypothetical protein
MQAPSQPDNRARFGKVRPPASCVNEIVQKMHDFNYDFAKPAAIDP